MDTIRQTRLVVNKNNIKHNIKAIQDTVGNDVKVMPVIKARAYGTGAGTLIDLFEEMGIEILAVAVVDEGIALRERGFKGEIVILNQPFEEEIELLLKYDLISSACIEDFIVKLNEHAIKENKIAKIHLEVDTGMGRTGISPKDISKYINLIKEQTSIGLEGLYTHFACSDTNFEYTESQIAKFDMVVEEVKKNFTLKYIHACNTGGIINFKKAYYNLVRPGIGIYGHFPDQSLKGKLDLIPSTILKTKIVFLHDIEKGESVSYNRSFIAEKQTKIATIPIGYGDGLTRNYRGCVVINGKLANIIGLINMDSLMVDVTDFEDMELGTDVYIWDNKNITVEEVAQKCGTISYEILSGLTPRVIKEFV